ncbi:MAG: hypothetical protein KBG20_05370 [Caldilineaceae bacterium]|nr:hypothetical protein [Caldilineaceae bacterium]MBP8106655.1 hypothetical protein [Caldilineaceae bacterium]MBP8122205.1 hypothetical protein [Caldilineaceae bacterium]MBP9071706.1 hypothetical protein [Caldilineaceae bacterium]
MKRSILTILSLALVGAWIALNYVPVDLFSFTGMMQSSQVVTVFNGLLVVGAALFVMLQLMLLDSSIRLGELMNEHKSAHAININVVREVIWTALPLASTLGLIVICYIALTA